MRLIKNQAYHKQQNALTRNGRAPVQSTEVSDLSSDSNETKRRDRQQRRDYETKLLTTVIKGFQVLYSKKSLLNIRLI